MKRFTETNKWDDPWFRSLPGVHKLVFLYIIDRCNNAGFWEVDMDAMAFHTKLEERHMEGAFKGLARGLVVNDGWVWVKNFQRHQKNDVLNPDNPAHRQIILLLNDQSQRFPDVQKVIPEGPPKGLKSPIGIGIGIGIGKGKGDSSLKKTRESKNVGTVEELRAYAAEIGLPESDGEAMFDHWTSNGWKNGHNPVKDWKAGIRKWKSSGWLPSQNTKPGDRSAPPVKSKRFPGLVEDLELPDL